MFSRLLVLLLLALLAVLILNRLLPGAVRERGTPGIRGWLVDMAHFSWPVLLVVIILRGFIAEPFRIPSESMLPTLSVGDYILVNKYRYALINPLTGGIWKYLSEPQRGDIVVFFPPDDRRYFIKRVVGLPGDYIDYRNRRLRVNGQEIKHSLRGTEKGARLLTEYTGDRHYNILHSSARRSRDFVGVVRKGHYFMMGDNRDNSQDSRFWGQVPRANLVGPAYYRLLRWQGLGHWPAFTTSGGLE